jgi:diguanylate cyclase (GGDEF)-like protein/PAS domain S-box-containing protein
LANTDDQITARVEIEYYRKDASTFTSDVSASVVRDDVGNPIGILGVGRDVTERKRAEEKLSASEEQYRLLVQNAAEMIIVAQHGVLRFANPKTTELTGYSNEELISMPFLELVYRDDRDMVVERHLRRLKGKSPPGVYTFRAVRKDGSVLWVEISVVLITWEGKPATLNLLADVTERKKAEEQLSILATHDGLTGLPNHTLFMDRLTLALAHAQRGHHKLAVMMLDLDRFKDVNDTLGHDVGDQLLKAVGGRLMALLRKSDTVARVGGDEFVILLPEVAQDDYAATAARKILSDFHQPFVIGGHDLHITSSIGVAAYPHDGEEAVALRKNADVAMYRAKALGRDNCQFFANQ